MKKTIILLSISVIIILAVVFFPKKRESKHNIEKAILLDNKRKVQSMTFTESKGDSLKIVVKGISYSLIADDKKELPVKKSVANTIIGLLEKEYDIQFISDKNSTLGLYQLDESNRLSLKIEFSDGNETIYFGKDATGYKGIYFLKNNAVYKLPGIEKNDLFKKQEDIIEKNIFSFSSSSVKEIEIISKKKSQVLTKFTKKEKKKGKNGKEEEKDVVYWKNNKTKKDYENYKVSDYLSRVSSLSCENFDLKTNPQDVEKNFIKKYIFSTDSEKYVLYVSNDKKAFASNQKYVFILNDGSNQQLLKDLK